jgi:diguanylate cyclase (GGDEF)-like protein/PAS domain S-box-containing protein
MGKAWTATVAVGLACIIAATFAGDTALVAARAVAGVFLLTIYSVRLRRDETLQKGPWRLILAGGSLVLLSALTRLVHGLAVNVDGPFPSPAEIPGMVGYVFIILAARSFWNHRAKRRDIDSALDGLLVAAAASVVVFSAILSDYLRDSSIDGWARTGNVAYTILDLTLIGFVARLAVGPGVRNTAWRLIAGATLLILLNDLFFLLNTTGSEWGLTLAYVASPTAFVLAAAAIQHPEAGDIAATPMHASPVLTTGRIVMLAAALLTLPAALLAALIRDTAPDLPVLVTGSGALAVLSLVRISLLFRAKERVADMDAALSESGRELLDASTGLEVAVAASKTIRLVVGEHARYAAVVGNIESARQLVVRLDPQSKAHIEPLAPGRTTPILWDCLAIENHHPDFVSLELGDHGQFGEMIVEVTDNLDTAFNLALQTMSAQITQALASMRLAEARFARRAEQRLTALVEQSADLVLVVGEDGLAQFASPNMTRVLGLDAGDLLSSDPVDLAHPEEADALRAVIEAPSQADEVPLAIECRLRTSEGKYRWFDVTTRDFSEDSEVGGVVLTARDVNEERAAKLGLQRSEQWFRGLVQNSSDVIAVLDEAGIFTYISPSAENLLNARPEELRGRNFLELLPPDQTTAVEDVRHALMATTPGSRTIEVVLERRDGSHRTTEVTVTDLRDDPSVQGLVLNMRDITDRKRLEDDLRHQVLHDDLTGLGSRVQFTNQLQNALQADRRSGSSVSVLFIDLDDFKNINDSLGHAAGDQVLVEISSRLQGRLRLHDRAARFGGDEFAVLLTDVYSESDVTLVADRIVHELSRPVDLLGHEVRLGVSVGIAIDDDGSQSPEDLLRAADVAMYDAKAKGKGRWAIFEAEMADQTVERFEISNSLARAIENDELMVHFQPILDLGSGRTAGVEALVRWNHPDRGMVAPASFIPLAERNGLIVPLGRAVLQESVTQVARWRAKGHDIYASVNISPVQLQRDGIVREILEIVDDAGLERGAVVLELTESALINDFELVVDRIDALRAAGLRVAIDDFGTGYATLRYADEFSADILKIDQTFVARLETQDDSTIVSTVLAIARGMGAETVAEGIEVPEQHRRLLSLGCRLGQGYYFARPAPAEVIGELLARELDGEALAGHSH